MVEEKATIFPITQHPLKKRWTFKLLDTHSNMDLREFLAPKSHAGNNSRIWTLVNTD